MSTLWTKKLKGYAAFFIPHPPSAEVSASTVSIITNSVFAIVIAIYVLLSKHILAAQVKKLMYAHLEPGQ